MKIALLLLFCLYLAKLLQNRSKEKKEYKNAEMELFRNVEQILGRENLHKLQRKSVWIGMPRCLISYSFGEPHKKTFAEDANNRWDTYFYEPRPYQYGGETKYRYGKEINFENKILTHFKTN